MFRRSLSHNTKLEEAIKRGNIDVVKQVIDADPECVSTDIQPNLTPLGLAAYRGRADIATELILRGADPIKLFKPPGSWGQMTPIEVARKRGHNDVVEAIQKLLPEPMRKKSPTDRDVSKDWEKIDEKPTVPAHEASPSRRHSDLELGKLYVNSIADNETLRAALMEKEHELELALGQIAALTEENGALFKRIESMENDSDIELETLRRMLDRAQGDVANARGRAYDEICEFISSELKSKFSQS